MVNIQELLWVTVNQGEPAALHLYHYPVTFFKGMGNIGHRILYFGGFIRRERFRARIAVTVLSAHDFGPYQHLVAAHRVF